MIRNGGSLKKSCRPSELFKGQSAFHKHVQIGAETYSSRYNKCMQRLMEVKKAEPDSVKCMQCLMSDEDYGYMLLRHIWQIWMADECSKVSLSIQPSTSTHGQGAYAALTMRTLLVIWGCQDSHPHAIRCHIEDISAAIQISNQCGWRDAPGSHHPPWWYEQQVVEGSSHSESEGSHSFFQRLAPSVTFVGERIKLEESSGGGAASWWQMQES